jgi:hypothetical protein
MGFVPPRFVTNIKEAQEYFSENILFPKDLDLTFTVSAQCFSIAPIDVTMSGVSGSNQAATA